MRTPSLRSLATVFACLSDSRRLRLLNILAEYESCVAYLVHTLHTVQPAISRDLALLRSADLVSSVREGKWVAYRVIEPKNPTAAAVLQNALEHIRHTSEAERDLERLSKLIDSHTAALRNAPKPKRSKGQHV